MDSDPKITVGTLSNRQEQAVAHLSLFAIDDWLEARDVAEAAWGVPDGRHFAQALVQLVPHGVIEERPRTFPLQYRLTMAGWTLAAELRGRLLPMQTRSEMEDDIDAIFA